MTLEHTMMQQLGLDGEDDLQTLRAIVQRRTGRDFDRAEPVERERLTRLAFGYVEPRLRFGVLDEELMQRIVAAREAFHADLPTPLANGFERYDPDRFNRSATLLDNALFGRVGHQWSYGDRRVTELILETFRELDLYVMVLGVGLQFDVGPGGRKLTASQRQKINLARALIKRPDYLLLNRPLSTLDARVQEQILSQVLDYRATVEPKAGLIWALSTASLAKHFDRVIVFDGSAPVEDGAYDVLVEQGSVMNRLVS